MPSSIMSHGGDEVRDVGSLNGTYVNRERIEEAVLSAVTRCRSASSSSSTWLRPRSERHRGDTVSSRTYLSIGDVLALLRQEFPDVTISKIRFLESQGLVNPERTPSGYRKFYDHDVERLQWVLSQQREHFLPLKVIKGRLEDETGEWRYPPPEGRRSYRDGHSPRARGRHGR